MPGGRPTVGDFFPYAFEGVELLEREVAVPMGQTLHEVHLSIGQTLLQRKKLGEHGTGVFLAQWHESPFTKA